MKLFLVLLSLTLFFIEAKAQDLTMLSFKQLDSLIQLNFKKGDYKTALPILEFTLDKSLKERGEMDSITGKTYNDIGHTKSALGKYQEAKDLYKKASEILSKIHKESHLDYIATLNNLANVYNRMGEYKASEDLFLKVKGIYEKYSKDTSYAYAINLNSLGFLYYNLGRYEETIELLKKSSLIFKKRKGEKDTEYAKSHFNMGHVYKSMGNLEETEAHFLIAGKIWKEIHGEDHPNYISYLNGLSSLYQAIGKDEMAIPLWLRVIDAHKKTLGETHVNYALGLQGLAYSYKNLKQYEKAEKKFQEALEVMRIAVGETHMYYISNLLNLATIYQLMKKMDQAERFFQEALQRVEKSVGKEHNLYSRILGDYGGLQLKLKNYKQSEKLYLESKAVHELGGNLGAVNYVTTLCNLGYLYSFMGRYDLSLDYYCRAILSNCTDTSFRQEEFKNNLPALLKKKFKSNFEIITALDGIYRLTKTKIDSTGVRDEDFLKYGYSALEVAIAMNENVQKEYEEDDKKVMLKRMNRLAGLAIERGLLLTEEGDNSYLLNSFSYAEKNKSVLLEGAIKGNRARFMGDLPDSLALYEISLQNEQKKIEKELATKKSEAEKVALEKKKVEVILKIEDFVKSIKDKYPKYHALKYENITAKAVEIQEMLTPKTMMLEYFVRDSMIYLFVLTNENIAIQEIKITRTELKSQVKAFRKTLSNYRFIIAEPDKAFELFADKSYWFYEHFIKNAIAENDIENLIIVTDDDLGHIPFEACIVERPKQQKMDYKNLHYLVQDYNMSYNYSATLWKENHTTAVNSTNGQMLAYAASYSKDESTDFDSREPHLIDLRSTLNPLPAVQSEIRTLSETFDGDFLYGEGANEANFKKQASNYGVIHLAMHGILNARAPMLSSLAFTENGDSLEDNFLHAYEISKLSLKTNLVVLSACETGFGKFEQGEGVLSLARSFMYAGVSSLVVSLWQVNDNSTAVIMKQFYSYLAEGMTKDAALRQAKINFIEHAKGVTAHPAFWSPFIQLGDNRPIQIASKGEGKLLLYGLGFALLVAVVGGVSYFKRKKLA